MRSMPQDKRSLPHFGGESRNVGFNAVIHRYSGEQLMDESKRGICGRNVAANLSHYCHECDRSNVGAFAAHVTACYDLESGLLGCVHIIWDELFLVRLRVLAGACG